MLDPKHKSTYWSKSIKWSILLLFLIIGVLSCDQKTPVENTNPMVASVGNRILLSSDLRRVIHPSTNRSDSIAMAAAYIDQWVREQLMTREASRFFSSDAEIEQLVEDYRGKLLKFNLEEQIIAARYDTLITDVQLLSFYGEMKEQFFLDQDIYRCIFARFEKAKAGLSDFRKDWNEDNMSAVHNFTTAFSEEYRLDTTIWYTWGAIAEWTDIWTKSQIDGSRKLRKRDAEYEYFLKIVEKVDKGALSPLEYIKPRLTRMLLHKRKQQILEDYKQELYEKALENNIIKLP